MSSALDKYLEDRQYLIDKAPDKDKKKESLENEFNRRVQQGKIKVSNGNYELTPSKETEAKVKEMGLGNKDGGKQKFKEGSKPDFLDLDKDGNKTEPMKQAAKQKVTAKGGVRTAIKRIKKAKDGARTGVRGTGAAKRGFRKARLS